MESTASYWCYRCTRFIRVYSEDALICPHCDSGFIEAVAHAPPSDSPRPFPAAAMYMIGPTRPDSDRPANQRFRRHRRNHGDRSPFNPVIVLRGPSDESRDNDDGGEGGGERRSFELYYDDGVGSGLRPLPTAMSEFLMGSGFERLLDQLSQIEVNGLGRHEQPPASKSAVESMPTVEIVAGHLIADSHCSHCAVCKEAFVLGSEAREMPCKHIYHSDCILPWLSMRNSCPVCRHELPTDSTADLSLENGEDEAVGLTIWRLPGGGFAVGRFTGGRRAGSSGELPAVFTEMDGGFNNSGGGGPRRVAWGSRRGRREEGGGGVGRVFRNLFSFLGRFRNSNSGSVQSSNLQSVSSIRRSRSLSSGSVFNRYFRRRNRAWVLGEQNGMARW